jgi:hypothetical protein
LCPYCTNISMSSWSRVLLGKLTGPQLVKKTLHLTAPERFLPNSQEPATCPYPEPDQSNPCFPIPILEYTISDNSTNKCTKLYFEIGFRMSAVTSYINNNFIPRLKFQPTTRPSSERYSTKDGYIKAYKIKLWNYQKPSKIINC